MNARPNRKTPARRRWRSARKAAALCGAVAALIGTLVPIAEPLAANAAVAGPSVTWETTDRTVVGVVYIRATAAANPSDSSWIRTWCLTQDGTPVTTNLAYGTNSVIDQAGVFNSATGCWTASARSLTAGLFGLDTTAWPDASHTYQLTVTDSSNRTATSTVLTLTTSNPGPSVTWETTDRTVSGPLYIRATAAADPSGTASIRTWCLTVNGAPVTTNLAYGTNSVIDQAGVFNSATGCWTTSARSLTAGLFGLDTTTWADGPYAFQLTVTDSSNRSTTGAALTLTTNNPGPTATWVTADRLVVRRVVVVTATAAADPLGTAKIAKWCFALDGVPVTQRWSKWVAGYPDLQWASFVPETGCYMRSEPGAGPRAGALSFDTTTWADGEHTLRLTVTDTSGRERVTTLTLITTNPLHSLDMTGIADGAAIKRKVLIQTKVNRVAEQNDIAIVRYCFYLDDQPCFEQVDAGTDKGWTWESAQIEDGAHSLRIAVEDSYGRVATSRTVRFTVANPRPTLRFTWPSSTKVTKQTIALSASAVFVADQNDLGADFCVKIDEGECEEGSFKTLSAKWRLNTTKLSNGVHTMQFVVTDSTGRITALPQRTFIVSNRKPTGNRPAGRFRTPQKDEGSASIRISTRIANASTLTIQYGRTPDALDGVKQITVASGGSTSTNVSINWLDFDQTYYFRVTASSALGAAKTYTFSRRSPSEARIVRTRCRNVRKWFFGYWPAYIIIDYWSSGEVDVSGPSFGRC